MGARERKKARLMACAEQVIDELLEWSGETQRPNLTQIEDKVLELRERFGEELARSGRGTRGQATGRWPRVCAVRAGDDVQGTKRDHAPYLGGRGTDPAGILPLCALQSGSFSPWISS